MLITAIDRRNIQRAFTITYHGAIERSAEAVNVLTFVVGADQIASHDSRPQR
jgi:hypothetical protein